MVSSVCCAYPLPVWFSPRCKQSIGAPQQHPDHTATYPPNILAFSAMNEVNSALYWMRFWQNASQLVAGLWHHNLHLAHH
jgi:hypothetical protein